MNNSYVMRARARATEWKATTPLLPDAARAPAPYFRGGSVRGLYPFCLPIHYARRNLLPEAEGALGLFASLGIVWHAATSHGPTNHLLSSQVQCVNVLEPLAHDPDRLRTMFAGVLDIVQPLEIEHDRLVTFEFIGSTDLLGECIGSARSRGAHCTAVDAAFRYRTTDGNVELALIEWKYTEDYRELELSPDKTDVRRNRYRALWNAPDGPLRTDVIPYDDMFVEPYYQLMRQQLLAWELEKTRELDADVVRLVHVSPAGNEALRSSLNRPTHAAVGGDVFDVWRTMLRRPDRFVGVDSRMLIQRSGGELSARYDHE